MPSTIEVKNHFLYIIEITLLGSVLTFWLCVCLSERERGGERERRVKLQIVVNEKSAV